MQDAKVHIKLSEELTPEQSLALQNKVHRVSLVGTLNILLTIGLV